MKNSFLIIHIRDKLKKDIGILKQNLYSLATGSMQNDYLINWNDVK